MYLSICMIFQIILLVNCSMLEPEVPSILLDNLHLTLSTNLLVDIYAPSAQTLKGYLGLLPKTSSQINYTRCSQEGADLCLIYGKMRMAITQEPQCHKIRWDEHIGGAMDCFLLGEHVWYGGGARMSQQWPLQDEMRSWYPTVTGDPLHHPSGNVVEHLWISSSGFSIFVDHKTPLFASFNDTGNGKLCFTSSSRKYPYQNQSSKKSKLTYTICSASSIKEVYTLSLDKWIEKPMNIPHEVLFHYPIWSTWARYKQDINEKVIMQFVTEITEYGFSGSQLEIDDNWEDCYGNLRFNIEKFPKPKEMVKSLKSMGFYTTLWVHPFCNTNCKAYEVGKKKGFWVKNKEEVTLKVKWWNGHGALLDVTNKEARQWFVERLQMLQKNYDIESFKFDAGEILWLEQDFVFHDSEVNLEPNLYSQLYAELAAEFGNKVEVRTGYNTQQLPIMLRLFDKYSDWNYANGLQSLIPNILHLSLLGYFFILPDMVGGNNYSEKQLPDRELYIRWLQANTFLPFIQMSIPPWDYDDEIVSITNKMFSLRDKYVDYIRSIAQSGEPIIRPLWWGAPNDADALHIDSQFLVGDQLLVAPVLTKGAIHRDIYLTEGNWVDVQKGKSFEGPLWLYEYECPLHILPFFYKKS